MPFEQQNGGQDMRKHCEVCVHQRRKAEIELKSGLVVVRFEGGLIRRLEKAPGGERVGRKWWGISDREEEWNA